MLNILSHRKLWNWTALILGGLFLGFISASGLMVFADLPQVQSLESYEPSSVTRLLDHRDKVYYRYFRQRRIPVAARDMPKNVKMAFLAAEDWRFYDHFGIDVIGLMRAIVENLKERRFAQGASTITQQLSRVLFLRPDKTIKRKLREAALALKIEQSYSKEEILNFYLNQIYLGEGAYGVEAASQTYFRKSIQELEPAELALLAGLPQSPSRYSPFNNPQRAMRRRNIVLFRMFQLGLLEEPAYLDAKERPLPLPHLTSSVEGRQSHFTMHVLSQLKGALDASDIYQGYLDIHTTLDVDLQLAAETATRGALTDYAKRHKQDPDKLEDLPQVALLAIDPRSGAIRAMVGSSSFAESQFNRALSSRRQPGSAFKPVVYMAALEKGYTQSSILEDLPMSFELEDDRLWEPKNYNDTFEGYLPLRRALEKSQNIPTIFLAQEIGPKAFIDMAKRLGIQSKIEHNLSSSLGSSSLTLAELATAYATFVNGGFRPDLHAVTHVRSTKDQENLWPSPPIPKAAIDPKLAYIMVDMLKGVVTHGTARFARELPCELGGKTGTTNENVDSFFVGIHPNLVTVTWMGFDDRTSLGPYETGSKAAGRMWKMFIQDHCQNHTEARFNVPDGLIRARIDHSSGMAATAFCPDVIEPYFLPGTQPIEACQEEKR